MNKLTIGIVFGGSGVESDVSIITAIQIAQALDLKKYNYILVYISKDNDFYIGDKLIDLKKYHDLDLNKLKKVHFYKKNNRLYISKINQEIDCIIPSVHGVNYEDGTIANYFRFLNVPVVMDCGINLGVMQDKDYTKRILKSANINTLSWIKVSVENFKDQIKRLEKLQFPIIIKPNRLGSSVGISIVNNIDELKEKIQDSFRYDQSVILEKALENYKEYNCAVLGHKEYELSAIEEVQLDGRFYSYELKYLSPLKKTLDEKIREDVKEQIKKTSLKVCEVLNLKGLIRIDYLFDQNTSKLYVNEINGIPGSFSYYLFEAKGKLFCEVLDKLIDIALTNHYNESLLEKNINCDILNTKYLEK